MERMEEEKGFWKELMAPKRCRGRVGRAGDCIGCRGLH